MMFSCKPSFLNEMNLYRSNHRRLLKIYRPQLDPQVNISIKKHQNAYFVKLIAIEKFSRFPHVLTTFRQIFGKCVAVYGSSVKEHFCMKCQLVCFFLLCLGMGYI